jgi:hypothetical protein
VEANVGCPETIRIIPSLLGSSETLKWPRPRERGRQRMCKGGLHWYTTQRSKLGNSGKALVGGAEDRARRAVHAGADQPAGAGRGSHSSPSHLNLSRFSSLKPHQAPTLKLNLRRSLPMTPMSGDPQKVVTSRRKVDGCSLRKVLTLSRKVGEWKPLGAGESAGARGVADGQRGAAPQGPPEGRV